MTAWIKLEKPLETDPRVLRMAKELGRRYAIVTAGDRSGTSRNAGALPGVTLVCGALARLWIYADTHAREDDTLDIGADELDEWLGIPGFCAMMPADWLVVIDEQQVELPGFHAHNGVEAKRRAQTSKRVAGHRQRVKRQSVTACNADALPDQTRPDQTRPDQTSTQSAPETRAEVPRETLDAIRQTYPSGTYRDNTWLKAERSINRLIEAGESPALLTQAAAAYALQQQQLGKLGTQFVMSPATFFDPQDSNWRGPFPLPKDPGQIRQDANIAAGQAWLAQEQA